MPERSVVIIGGGIIGSCIAYYLANHDNLGDTKITVIEASSIAAGASGKGGGFLAEDWHSGPTASLGKLSFDLHQKLADEHDGHKNWGYRRLTTFSLDVDHRKRGRNVPGVEWLSDVTAHQELGDTKKTAQVHPYQFTMRIIKLAQEKKVKEKKVVDVFYATAEGLEFGDDGKVKCVVAKKKDGGVLKVDATDVVFAAGPWTGKLAKSLLKERAGAAATIVPSKCSTSIVVRTKPDKPLTPHALFTSLSQPRSKSSSPEVYCRPDGTAYICGAGMHDPSVSLPAASELTPTNPPAYDKAVEALKERMVFISEWFEGMEVEVKQACFRPDSSRTGAPIIGKIEDGIWMASGHQVWGILMAPGTGKVMADLILEGKTEAANIEQLRPR
jgi:glycine/D-amino acid oxidase-like deaminating enzyme